MRAVKNPGMKFLCALSTLLCVIAGTQLWAAEPSVWEQAKAKSYGIEGRVKAISIDESARQVTVKVEQWKDSSKVESVKVCSQDLGSSIQTFEQSEKMTELRQAMAQGTRVKIVYNGPFDRCLSQVITLND